MNSPVQPQTKVRRLKFIVACGWLVLFFLLGFLVMSTLLQQHQVALSSESLHFERPEWGWALLTVPLLFFFQFALLQKHRPRIRMNHVRIFRDLPKGWRYWCSGAPVASRLVALTLFILALMGPQSLLARDPSDIEGIDIMLALDVSLSMQAADIEPNRFEATKEVVSAFIRRRPNDRMGAVVFGRDAYTLLPLTTDKEALQNVIANLELGMIDGQGTTIGNAAGVALNRLRNSDAKSKIIILLTDGDSNSGNISPEQATEFASALEVKIYPILMGKSDETKVKRGFGLFGRTLWDKKTYPINPELLQSMANDTEGTFFQAADRKSLEESFHAILDALEKSELEDYTPNYVPLFQSFLLTAFIFILLEMFLRVFVLRRWP